MPLFSRSIDIEVEEEGEGLRIKGKLSDRRSGEDLHGIEAEMLVTVWDGEIKAISGSMPASPMQECAQGLESLQALTGISIKPGFSDVVKNTVGSNRGCSHLAALVMNMGNVSVQGRGAYLRKHIEDEKEARSAIAETGKELGLIDSCVCWREDGPIMRRWREREQQGE